jgi:uncharacterized protein YndB with AHSA1/START domain
MSRLDVIEERDVRPPAGVLEVREPSRLRYSWTDGTTTFVTCRIEPHNGGTPRTTRPRRPSV